ncbi:hypothetical protein TDB9533_03422 [Thalassocella blandensis]|nr:hypothetical protein TDB9533_03422 [Thalassocella blandensis]
MNLLLPIPTLLFWLSSACALSILLWALKTAAWHKLIALGERQHMWLGAIALLSLGWTVMGVNVQGTLRLHPMLVTSLTLVFGFRLAILAAALAIVVTTFFAYASWQAVPFVWLVSACLPATTTYILWRAISLTRIQNLFLYTLGVGFVGGLLTPLVTGMSTLALLWLFQFEYWPLLWHNAYLFLLFVFPEGFINGMIVSALAVMTPHLVRTYDDDFYLK